jgi:PEP-CTERM motif
MHISKLLLLAISITASASANTIFTVTIDVMQDGTDHLRFTGNTLQWIHSSDFANGGVTGGSVPGLVNVLGNTVTANNPYITVNGTASGDYSTPFSGNWYNGMQGLSCSTLPGGCPYTQPVGFEYVLPGPYSLSNLLGNVTLTTLVCQGAAYPAPNVPGNCGRLLGDPAPTIANAGGVWDVTLNDSVSGAHEFKIQLSWTVTPEPESFALVGMGLGALAFLRRKRA